jgi:hypothetical protein
MLRAVDDESPTVARLGNKAAWGLASFGVLYFAVTCLLASRGPLTNDEIYTVYVSRQPLGAIWTFLLTGAEQLPPLFFVITRLFVKAFGESAVVLRLPAMLGFALMSVCLFNLVVRRAGALYGTVAMLVPLATSAYNPFAWQARPYGLFLGLASVALVAWDWAAKGHHRPIALFALTASMMAAVSSHYYAILLLVPLGMGEATRTWRRRRIDGGVWIGLGLSLVPLVAFIPLMRAAQRYSLHFWSRPSGRAVYDTYTALLPPYSLRTGLGLGVVLLLTGAVRVLRKAAWHEEPRVSRWARCVPPLPGPHIVAVLGYTALPLLSHGLGRIVTGVYVPRYALPATIGIAVVYAYFVRWLFQDRAWGAVAVALFLSVAVGANVAHAFRVIDSVRTNRADTYAFLERHRREDTVIAVASVTSFLELQDSAPTDLRKRLIYLADPQAAVQHAGWDSDSGLVALGNFVPLNVQDYASFLARRQSFLVYTGRGGWVIAALQHDGLCLEVDGQDHSGRFLLLATPSDASQPGCADISP